MKTLRTAVDCRGSFWGSWAAAWWFAAWLLATPGLVPALVCVLGGLDGQHEVSVAGGRDATVVVLHHEGGFPNPQHRHSFLSGILVAFSQNDRDSQDHLLVFPRSESAVSEDPVLHAAGAVQEIPKPMEVPGSLFDFGQNWDGVALTRAPVSSGSMACAPRIAQTGRVLRI